MLRAAAFVLLTGVAFTLVLASACRSTEGPTGVHVAVTLAPGWLETDAFDHITVVAHGGGRTSVVCLSPQAGAAAAFATEAAATDPCADDARVAWLTVPTTTTWKLDEKPRTINIEGFAEGDAVAVTADARLGGGAVLGHAAVTAVAAVGTASVSVALVRGATPTACGAVLGASLLGDASTPGVACGLSSTCLCAYSGRGSGTEADCLGSAQGISCNDAGFALDPASLATCTDHDVIRVPIGTGASRDCLEVGVRGHMYRCANGDAGACVPTTDCIPPELALHVRRAAGGDDAGSTSLGCIPPLVFDVPFVVPIHGNFGIVGSLLALEALPPDEPTKACRVDFEILGTSDCPR